MLKNQAFTQKLFQKKFIEGLKRAEDRISKKWKDLGFRGELKDITSTMKKMAQDLDLIKSQN